MSLPAGFQLLEKFQFIDRRRNVEAKLDLVELFSWGRLGMGFCLIHVSTRLKPQRRVLRGSELRKAQTGSMPIEEKMLPIEGKKL